MPSETTHDLIAERGMVTNFIMATASVDRVEAVGATYFGGGGVLGLRLR